MNIWDLNYLSHKPNRPAVSMLVCLRSWLSNDIWPRNCLCL